MDENNKEILRKLNELEERISKIEKYLVELHTFLMELISSELNVDIEEDEALNYIDVREYDSESIKKALLQIKTFFIEGTEGN